MDKKLSHRKVMCEPQKIKTIFFKTNIFVNLFAVNNDNSPSHMNISLDNRMAIYIV